jgi:hypothetical protein
VAVVNAERLAGRAVGAALAPQTPDVQAARLALDIIDAVDPKISTVTEVTGPLSAEAIDSMTLTELMSFAQQQGITPPQAIPAPLGAVVEGAVDKGDESVLTD